ncbi:uncharacterized protein [Haliotis asinina]|uniref:uncharacterized protein n=1 Tax=Haliotis asinina TaxID=109174 RepID=UPI003532424E
MLSGISSNIEMATKEKGLVIDVGLYPEVITDDGEKSYITDIKPVYDILRDVHLLQIHLRDEKNFKLVDVLLDGKFLTLRVLIFDLQELKSLSKAVEDGSLGEKLLNYATEKGLEASLGWPMKAETDLSFQLEITKQNVIEAESFLMENRHKCQGHSQQKSETGDTLKEKSCVEESQRETRRKLSQSGHKTDSASPGEVATCQRGKGAELGNTNFQLTEFFVFVASPRHKKQVIDFVTITSENWSLRMDHFHGNIWKFAASYPSNVKRDTYFYQVSYSHKGHIWDSHTLTRGCIQNVKIGTVHLDFWEWFDAARGYIEHVEAIILRCKSQGMKASIEQLDTLSNLLHYNVSVYLTNILDALKKYIDRNTCLSSDAYTVLSYMFGKLMNLYGISKRTKCLSHNVCMGILHNFQKMRPESVPEHSVGVFAEVAEYTTHIAFPEEKCKVLKLLEFAFPFLPKKFFSGKLSECIQSLKSESLCKDVDSLAQIIRHISEHFYRDEEGCQELLLKILRHSTVQQVKMVKDECTKYISKNELEDLFEMKVVQELKHVGKGKHFEQLLDLYALVEESSLTDSLCDQIRSTCLAMITNSQMKDEVNEDAAMKLVSTPLLFSHSNDRTEVLQYLAAAKNALLHGLYIKLLKIQYLDKDSTTAVLSKYTQCWLDTAISNLGAVKSYGNKVDDLEKVYMKLGLALSLPQITEVEDLTVSLTEKAFGFLHQISVHDLLHKFSKTDMLQNSTVLSVFQEHLQRHLFKGNIGSHPSGILSDITRSATKDGEVYVCRSLHARVITLAVNYSGLQECPDDNDALMLMLQNWQFWRLVFNIKGEFQKRIMQNQLAQRAKKIGTTFKAKLENKTLAVKFLRKLTDGSDGLICGFCEILVSSSSNTDYEAVRGELNKLMKAITVAEGDKKLLTTVLKRISSFNGIYVPDLSLAQDILKMKISQFQQGDLPVECILDKTHWDPFRSFLTHSEKMTTAVQSAIYWQTCMELTKELLSKMDVSQTDTAADPEEDICFMFGNTRVSEIPEETLRICAMLVEDGLRDYKKIWDPLLKEEDAHLGRLLIIVETKDITEEIRLAEISFTCTFPKWIVHAFEVVRAYSQYSKKLQVISKVMSILQHNAAEDESFTETVHAFSALKDENFDLISLYQLRHIRNVLDDIEALVTEDLQHVLKELSSAKGLIDFLKDKPMDDLRNLIDAVEEHSEQSIQESTVSALIAVKRFLSPMMHSGSKKTVLQVLAVLNKSVNDSQVEKLAVKVNICKTHLHGLRTLLKNVANRGEMTKDVVKNTLKEGAKFAFKLDKKGCSVKLSYKSHGVHTTHTRADLNDLRSRVLLMVNTESKRKTLGHQKDKVQMEYESFIIKVDEAICIANILDRLRHSGYPDCRGLLKGGLDSSHLEAHRKDLETTLTVWQNALSDSRRTHYWLNFFYPEQLRTIHLYLQEGKDETMTRNLLFYTGCQAVSLNSARMTYQTVCASLDVTNQQDTFGLETVGITLDKVLSELTYQKIPFPNNMCGPKQPVRMADAVRPGNIFVASLDENSSMIIPTVLALYLNTTGHIPLPHQLLFCQEDTQWEDIELLLNRCHGSQNLTNPQLFVIVSVEKLSSDVQFLLVESLKSLAHSNVLMAVICEGSHHPFLDNFGDSVNQVQPLSESSMETCLQNLFPNVVTVTSDLPGQGKSETIQERAHTQNLDISTLHLSGDVTPPEIIRKLRCLDLSPSHVLHLDIGLITRPFDLEKLLFQLIVLKTISHKSELFTLVTSHIYIEIANTIDCVLRNSLQTITFFNREHVRWQNYDNFCVSQEICSPVQVVCNFLNVYKNGEIDVVDLYFSGEKQCKPLNEQRCQELLRCYFSYDTDLSFTIVQVLLNLLADQLKKFSCSHFFRTQTVAGMLGTHQVNDVKTQVLKALLEMSKEFAARSMQSSRQNASGDKVSDKQQMATTLASAKATTQRVDSMIQWCQSNHLIVVFHNQDIQTLSALYRSKQMVQASVRKLFETQIGRKMPEFSDLPQTELQKILQHVARSKQACIPQEELNKIDEMYALTPDNLLKMVLIVLRVRAHIPVILMGDTGCGKTSLIHYLSKICGVLFSVQNIHAGVEESDIVDFVLKRNAIALSNMNESVWVFLDEINTCNHLGLINDIICHHCCQGNILAPNLIVMAACNPYKLRTEESIFTAGLDNKVLPDEQSKLVYRVNPLPESMIDYIWDYGSLSKTDEESYIRRMINNAVSKHLLSCLVELLTMSQEFIRKKEQTASCVSLRDVNRCRNLIKWFQETLKMKSELMNRSLPQDRKYEIKAVILALAHVYHSRLPDTSSRKAYRENLSRVFERHGDSESETEIFKIIHEEQRDIIERMEMPDGIAKNTALQENVFVIMISILNRIPVFIVGKPGCSKSLSLQLIKSNLRGPDSTDPYFQRLPQLYCVAFQGSESSTSDGIIKVFEKAERFRESTKEENVLPVVVLDEIGLAETSKFNPLKVLHSRLEPGHGEVPNVAVVGISNWALDAAKMNRAIHLSRPDMDATELYHTGLSISEATLKDGDEVGSLLHLNDNSSSNQTDEALIKAIADAYFQYVNDQRFKNFHGLRDYYSLVKYVSRKFKTVTVEHFNDDQMKVDLVVRGLLRNFGGLSSEVQSVIAVFKEHLGVILSNGTVSDELVLPSTLELVQENIEDRSARHLLLVTRGESALSIVEDLLRQSERQHVTILGSHFDEDLNDDYSYRILSKIILCMEQGVVLILKDLDSIYGSLYDMLNQNYSKVGLKKTCRVAHGAYSNPVCHVHEDFRCIVLVEENKLDLSDPPFLNRFEKQCIRLSDILTDKEKIVAEELETWMTCVTKVTGHKFRRSDLIPFDSPDLIASLVHYYFSHCKTNTDHETIVDNCKMFLIRACTPEGIVRLQLSQKYSEEPYEVSKWQDYYYRLPIHGGLQTFVDYALSTSETNIQKGKEMIFSHTNVHVNILSCLDVSSEECQVEKLSSFKSEKHLSARLHAFWCLPEKKFLIVQCLTSCDRDNILLMKSLIEKELGEYKCENVPGKEKYVFVILHMDRNDSDESFSLLNYLSGWNLTVVDTLEPKKIPLTEFLLKQKLELVNELKHMVPLGHYLFWSFTLIKYHSHARSLTSLRSLIENISTNSHLMEFIEGEVFSTLETQFNQSETENWQVLVACDQLKLYTSLTLHGALENELMECMKYPLAAMVYKLEAANAWDCAIGQVEFQGKKSECWRQLVSTLSILDISDVPHPQGPESYPLTDPALILVCPFSKIFIERIESLKELCTETLAMDYPGMEIDDIEENLMKEISSRLQNQVYDIALELFEYSYGEQHFSDYLHDFITIMYSNVNTDMEESVKLRVVEWSFLTRIQVDGLPFEAAVTSLHVTHWLHLNKIEAELRLVDACLSISEVSVNDVLQTLEPVHMLCPSSAADKHSSSDTQASLETHTEERSAGDLEIIDDVDVETSGENTTYQENNEHQDVEAVENSVSETCSSYVKPQSDIMSTEHNHTVLPESEQDTSTNLVTFACQKLIPTEKLFETSAFQSWIGGVGLVLSLASEVSLESKVFQSLRMCNEFALLVSVPHNTDRRHLVEIGHALESNQVESDVVFKKILEVVHKLNEDKLVPTEALQHFFACYISICHATDPETSVVGFGLEVLKDLTIFQSTLNYFGPTLCQILMTEMQECDLINDDLLQYPVLQNLDRCIIEFHEKGQPDSQLACLCLDVIEKHFTQEGLELEDDNLDTMLKCDEMYKCEGLSLKHITALAYLKTCLSRLACGIQNEETVAIHVLQRVNGILQLDSDDSNSTRNIRTKALQNYFVKALSQHDGLKTFEDTLYSHSQHLLFTSEVKIADGDRLVALELCPMQMTWSDKFLSVSDGYFALPKDKSKVISALHAARTNPQFTYCMFGVALQHIYLVKTINPLTDSERTERAKMFCDLSKGGIHKNQVKMLEALCTCDEFKFPLLQMDRHKSARDQHLVIWILHLTCTVLAFNPTENQISNTAPLWLRLLMKPEQISTLYIPGGGYDESSLHLSKFAYIKDKLKDCLSFRCKCGLTTVFHASEDVSVCHGCQENFESNKENVELSGLLPLMSSRKQGYIYIDSSCVRNEFLSVGTLSPAAFRLLQMAVHGCLAMSLALGFTTTSDLSKILNIPEEVDVVHYITKHLQCHWDALSVMAEMGNAQLGKLLNFTVKDGMSFWVLSTSQFCEPEDRVTFEDSFSDYFNKIIVRRFGITQGEVRCFQKSNPDSSASSWEMILAEASEEDNMSERLPRLMRENVSPSIENMEREFVIQQKTEKFPIMALVFEKKNALSLLKHLIPLIQWHMCTIRHSSNNSRVVECRTVEDFIHMCQKEAKSCEKSDLMKTFETFKQSWNQLREEIHLLKHYNEFISDMPRVHIRGPLETCIMTKPSALIIQVLKALQSIQNQFLTDSVIVSLSLDHLSTSFLKLNNRIANLHGTAIENVTPRHIVTLPDLLDMTKFSQPNTELGHGRERQYDMYQIEVQVVAESLVNMPLLLIGSKFPMIRFYDERLHRTEQLLEDIINIVGHDTIDKDIIKSIASLREKSSSNMQTLIDYLEMTFTLLKRAPLSGRQKQQTLNDFLMAWHSFFPQRVLDIDAFCKRIRLTQSVSLYEYVEDLVADIILDRLDDTYRVSMPEECESHMNTVLGMIDLKLQEALLSALKKTVFRYIRFQFAKPADPLSPLLTQNIMWPEGALEALTSKIDQLNAELIHPCLCVEHICDAIHFITQAVEELKMKDISNSSQYAGAGAGQKQSGTVQQRKKNLAKKFRKR